MIFFHAPFRLTAEGERGIVRLSFLEKDTGEKVFMGNTQLKAMFIGLFKAAISGNASPPVKPEDFPDFTGYLRAIAGHETRTRESCDSLMRHLIRTGPIPPGTGEWETYFISLRIGAALAFLDECGGSGEEGQASGISVKLPKDNGEVARLLLCDLWARHFCPRWVRLDAVSKYFPGSDAI